MHRPTKLMMNRERELSIEQEPININIEPEIELSQPVTKDIESPKINHRGNLNAYNQFSDLVRMEGDNKILTERTSNGSFGAIEVTRDSLQEETDAKLLTGNVKINNNINERF